MKVTLSPSQIDSLMWVAKKGGDAHFTSLEVLRRWGFIEHISAPPAMRPYWRLTDDGRRLLKALGKAKKTVVKIVKYEVTF